ncbi:hypothetical protein [Pontibacter litorisediminis]|uniref:hypothetical protein n=1 Tax=Pontibacter litorisediminis TaxID=1846260 RepID=UPI0023EB147A|nr:hypothetical protein [Pontibacter litorisediminis]
MYVNLYPGRQLRSTKKSMLLLGLFLFFGGGYALLREFLWIGQFREGWAVASAVIMLLGILSIAYGSSVLHFKDAFFSMTPDRIAYRLSLFGGQTVVEWPQVEELKISVHAVNFVLRGGAIVKMRLTAIQDPKIARHVSRSIHLAALEKGIAINGVKPSPSEPAMQA